MGATPSGKRIAARFDSWVLLREPLELLRDGQRVRLQELPLRILDVLVSKPAELVTRDELVARLWPKGIVEFDAGLNTAMRKLRAALGDDADAPRFIETVPRQGYRFIGPLEHEPMESAPAAPSSPAPSAPPSSAPAPGQSPASLFLGSRIVRRHTWLPVAALVLLVGAAVMAYRWQVDSAERGAAPAAAASRDYRIAVLPFENLSPDPANAFFTDGMHEEVLTTLTSRATNLEVISRATMMSYRTTTKPAEVARDLGVTHVLAGTVRRDGEQVRITVTLIDAASDSQLWAQSFNSDLRNAMTLQAEVAADVAGKLAVQLSANRSELPPPRDLEAYDLWLKGVLAWQDGGAGRTLEEVPRVEAMFSRALELDDSYAAAYADRARVRTFKFVSGLDVSEANVASARADLAMARKLAGDAPHVLVREATLAVLVDRDVDKALELIARAEASAPLTADYLMSKANFLRYAGQLEASLAAHERAASLDPGNPTIVRFWIANLFTARRPAEASRVIASFDRRFPGRIQRGEPLFAFTGSTARWRAEADIARQADPLATLSAENDLLRYEGRMAELADLLARTDGATFRQHGAYGEILGATRKPVAELSGWLHLLSGDEEAAAREGAALLAFVKATEPTRWNGWWLTLLAAEGALFSGDTERAAADARAARELASEIPNLPVTLYTAALVARILAWSGAADDAITLLEELSTGTPSLGPAAITRDPLFSVPLQMHARYLTLEKKLEAEIALNQSLL
jgi:TolB-like protein/DNA-binding winged helix-turn-helix (wHTH) protein